MFPEITRYVPLLRTCKKNICRKCANKTVNVSPTHTEKIKPADETKARIQVTLGEWHVE